MPDITLPPVQIDPSAEQSGLAATGCCSQGWYKVGSNFYCVLLTQVGSPFNLNIFKSTDGGATWVKKAAISVPIAFPTVWCVFDGANTIQISYSINTANPSTVSWSSFNTNTDTATLNNLPNLTDCRIDNGQPGVPFSIHTNGHIICFYSQNTLGNWGFRTNSGGAWSAFTAVQNTAAHSYFVTDVVFDPSNDFSYVVYEDNGGGANHWHVSVFNAADANVLDSDVAAKTNDDVFGHGAISADTLYLPVSRTGGLAASDKASIFVGATAHSGPAWTITDLDAGQANNRSIISVGVCIDSSTGNPTALWEFEDLSGNPNVARKSVFSGGTWSAFSTYYDVVANPPNSVPANQQAISQIDPVPGSVNAIASMASATAGFAAFALLSGSAPPPVTAPVNMGPSGGGNFLIPGNPGGLAMILPNPPTTYLCRYSQTIPCECPQGEIEYVLGKDLVWIRQ